MRRAVLVGVAVGLIASAACGLWALHERPHWRSRREQQVDRSHAALPPPALSVEEAQRRVTAWAKWVHEPLVYRPFKDDRDPLRIEYRFATASGSDRVSIDARTGERLDWENPALMAEWRERRAPVRDTSRAREAVQRTCQDFMARWCEDAVGRFTDGWSRWTETTPETRGLAEHERVFLLDYATLAICSFAETTRPLRVDTTLRISGEQARQIILRELSQWPYRRVDHLRSAEPQDPAASSPTQARVSEADVLGLQRLEYAFFAELHPRGVFAIWPLRRWSPEDTVGNGLDAEPYIVDATTGETLGVSSEAFTPRFLTFRHRYRRPIVYVGRHDLRLEYRPRVRRGVPYMYVGYLATWLWPGQVTETGNAAEVQYAGRSWTLTAGRRTAVCAGRACEFRHAPLLEYGRLYLPPDMFHSITGWHMDYRSQRHSDEIHLYTDAGQAPSQPPT